MRKLPSKIGTALTWVSDSGMSLVASRVDENCWSVAGQARFLEDKELSDLLGSAQYTVLISVKEQNTQLAKWRGKSTNSLKVAMSRVSETMTAEMVARRTRTEAQAAMKTVVEEFVGAPISHYTQTWDCPEGPLGFCVYPAEDISQDNCMFCGDPLERK